MRAALLWSLDTCLRWRNWLADRRDSLARLQAHIEQQAMRHQQEVERLKGEILIRDKEIELLTAVCVKHRAHIEAETAILARQRAEADNAAKLAG